MINLENIGAHDNIMYTDSLARLYPELFKDHMAKSVTFQVTDDCCMACTYCY